MAEIVFSDIINNSPDALTSGRFREILTSLNEAVREEHAAGRITGDAYAKVYLGALQVALDKAFQFDVLSAQKNLYDTQADAFRYRHKKDVAKLLIDGWTITASGLDSYTTSASTDQFGLVINDAIDAADWPA